MKKYDKYKPSGIDWLGDIPTHWEMKRCKDIFTESSELSKYGTEDLLSVSEYYGVAPRKEKIEEDEHLTRADSLEGYRICKKKDLVINIMLAWKTGLGVSQYDGIVSPAYAVYHPIGIDSNYYHYLLRTSIYTSEFKRNSRGIIDSRLRLYTDKFYSIHIPVPPLDEQTAIAKYLDEKTSNIDRRIELLKQKIDKYKELRRSLISQVVTRGLNPNVKLKPSGIDWLGDIPEHWKLRRIKDVIKLINGRAYSQDELLYEGKYKVLRVGNFFTNESWYYSNLELEKEKYCHKNDLLYAWSASIGPYIWTEDNTIFHYHIWKVDLNNKFTLKYAYYLLLAVTKRKMFDMHGSAMVHLTMEDMNYTFIPFPNITEQTAIADYLDEKTSQIDTIVSNCEKQIEQLTELRRSLISQVVTGKIKVTD